MAKNIESLFKRLPAVRRKKIEARAAQLIAEEMTLRQLRRARKLTQQKLAKSLRIGQEGVSKIEQRTDLLISTLRNCVKGMGGDLHLVAEFPDRPPVELVGFAAMENERGKKEREARV
jgi:transcriptional regulator with XRE-family HTH domain